MQKRHRLAPKVVSMSSRRTIASTRNEALSRRPDNSETVSPQPWCIPGRTNEFANPGISIWFLAPLHPWKDAHTKKMRGNTAFDPPFSGVSDVLERCKRQLRDHSLEPKWLR